MKVENSVCLREVIVGIGAAASFCARTHCWKLAGEGGSLSFHLQRRRPCGHVSDGSICATRLTTSVAPSPEPRPLTSGGGEGQTGPAGR